MRGFGRGTGLVLAALLGGALLTPAGTAQVQAAPPSPGNLVAEGKNWQVRPVAGGYQVTLHLDTPAPKRDAAPLIAVNGVPVGVAMQSPDQRTLWLTSPDPALRNAKDVRLAWSGDQPGKKSLAGGATDEYWLNAPLGPKLAVDSGATGKYRVETAEYNLGDEAVYLPGLGQKSEVVGKVYSPRGATGARPLVIFLHGRHESCYGDAGDPDIPWPCAKGQKPVPSYRGYDGPAEALASHGYQVVSISSNAINGWDSRTFDQGAQARAELILDHLDLWKKWATVGGGPFGRKFVGRIDFTNIGLMGHSRGGEGVARAAVVNADRGGKYGIRAVLPLAPVDFARSTVPGVAMSVLLPYCDGDVSDLQGQKFYDDTRYAVSGDPAARSTVLVMGANHNYFNTEWTPGQSVAPSVDDWEYTDPENPKGRPCGSEYAGRLTPKEQQAVGTAYIAGFFRLQLGHETKLLPLLDGSNAHPASAGRAVVRVVSQAPAASRRDVNRLDKALPVTGKATASVCAGVRMPTAGKAPAACAETQTPWDSPHWFEAWFASAAQTTAVTKLGWTGTDGVLKVGLAAAQRDVRKYSALTFRAAPDPASAPKLDLTVRVVDGHGRKADVPVSAVSDALVRLPGTAGPAALPKNLLRTVRIPTGLLKGIDLRDVRSIELRTDKVAKGSVFLSDLAFSTPGLGKSAPTRLPQLSASSVGKVVEGDKVKTYDIAVTMSRPSVRPVTVHAESYGDVAPVAHDLVFKPGQTRKQVKVTVTGDTIDSYDHFVSLVLSVPTEAQLGSSFGNIEVIDDDPSPTLTVLPATAAENAGEFKFGLKLSAPSGKYIYVRGELRDGTALARQDFRAPGDESSGQPFREVYAMIEPGETTGELVAELVDDKVTEPTESFSGALLEVVNADLGSPATATGTITDDD